jgi:hypothetical protein
MAHILQEGDNPQNCNSSWKPNTKQDIQESFPLLQMKYLSYEYDIFILKTQIVNAGIFWGWGVKYMYIKSKFVSNET